VVARARDGAAGFVTGYRRPDAPDTLMVWQVAVGSSHRRHGLAAQMLDHLAERVGGPGRVRFLETTITPSNAASQRLFASFAERRGAPVEAVALFEVGHFPPDAAHEAEVCYRIGPW
jgi:L-2,4-diaminobutyric acid acetyltransferase